MKRYRFIIEGLTVDVYQPSEGSRSDAVGVYIYGFPGSIGETAPTRAMLELGYTVLQPHYPGTYDSAGKFSPTSAIGMFGVLSKAVSAGSMRNIKDDTHLKIGNTITLCVGHSFGAFAALHGAPQINGLEVLLLLGPAVAYGNGPHACGLKENGDKHVSYVRRSRPFTYRLDRDEEWASLYAGELDSQPGCAPKSLRIVKGLVGEDDKYFDRNILCANFTNIIEQSLSGTFQCSIDVIPGVGHGPNGLISAKQLDGILS